MLVMDRRILAALVSLGVSALASAQTILRVDQNAPPGGLQDGSTWRDAFLDLNDALDPHATTISLGAQIWVARGTYRPVWTYSVVGSPSGSRNTTFLIPNGVGVYGGFKGRVALSNYENRAGATALRAV